MKKWNHYVCPDCGGTTVARHDDEGVTPFIIRCRAKDFRSVTGNVAPGCNGMAQSLFFDCPQEDGQKPDVIFYRPDAVGAIDAINKEPERYRAWLLEHYQKGGSLMRDANSSDFCVCGMLSENENLHATSPEIRRLEAG